MNKFILFSITALFCYIVFRPGVDSSSAPEFNQTSFQTAIDSGKPVVVDFRANWYRPSKKLAPTINQLARESSDLYMVGKIDVDRYTVLTQRYRVKRYPTLLIFKDGEVVDELDTTQSVEEMQNQIYRYL